MNTTATKTIPADLAATLTASTDTVCQDGEKWEDFTSRRWATENPHQHALVTAWYSMPEGQAIRATDKDDAAKLRTVLDAHRVVFIQVNRDYALAYGHPTAASIQATLTEEDRKTQHSGVYAVDMAAKGEAAAWDASAHYLAAADAPEGSEVAAYHAKKAEAARRDVMSAIWQTEHRAKDAHGWDPMSHTLPGRRALVALRIAAAEALEMAAAWDDATGQSYGHNDLEVDSQWREAAIGITHAQDAPLYQERRDAAAARAYVEAVQTDRWDADLMTKRRAEAGLPTM